MEKITDILPYQPHYWAIKINDGLLMGTDEISGETGTMIFRCREDAERIALREGLDADKTPMKAECAGVMAALRAGHSVLVYQGAGWKLLSLEDDDRTN